MLPSVDTWNVLQLRTAAKHARARQAGAAGGADAAAAAAAPARDLIRFIWVRSHTETVGGERRFAVSGYLRSRTSAAWLSFVQLEFGFYSPDGVLLETRSTYVIGERNVRVQATGEYTTAMPPVPPSDSLGGYGFFDLASGYAPGEASRWELVSATAETYDVDLPLSSVEIRATALVPLEGRLEGFASNRGDADAPVVMVSGLAFHRGEMDVATAGVDGIQTDLSCGGSSGSAIPAQYGMPFSLQFSLPRISSVPFLFAAWDEVGLAPAAQTFGAEGGTGTFTVVRPCGWAAASDAPWIAITSGQSGTGTVGAITFTVEANAGDARRGTISVSGMDFTVVQAGGGACGFLVSPAQIVIGPGAVTRSVQVTAAAACSWSAESDVPWLAPVSPGGSGSASVLFHAEANPTRSSRSGMLHVGNDTAVVTQSPASRGVDFNGDGGLDLLFWDGGTLETWFMKGLLRTEAMPLIGSGGTTDPRPWLFAGTGDFSGDGWPDLLWRRSDGALGLWVMNGLRSADGFFLTPATAGDPDWTVRSVADFDGDGRVDLVWQHPDGRVGVWFMNGSTLRASASLGPGTRPAPGWLVAGSGDFNGDGRPDLVWQHEDGRLGAWLMRGAELLDAVGFSPPRVEDARWKIRAVGDLDGDDWPDLIWQHTGSGELAAWRMKGTALLSGDFLAPSQSARQLVGPR